ncbi:PIN domain-containing protein [Deinococcus radiomollis]|uniref:PIN domain-containing protein n=1 Tax=Deinococcus radiomollis TaxID=468916 RepID=UPI003891C8BB
MSSVPTAPLLLDASAILALLRREPGAQQVQNALRQQPCFVSSVTLTELEGKLIGRGEYTAAQIRSAVERIAPLMDELAFNAECRGYATFYYARKSPYDLSLGDAACLGTAEAHSMSVLTAEQNWAKLPDLPFGIELIR